MITVGIHERAGTFAEDKDVAAAIREKTLRPAVERKERIRLDFKGVEGATQSFVHALISELIRKSGAVVVDRIEFKNCNPTVRGVIEIVVEYSQLIDGTGDREATETARAQRRKRPTVSRGKKRKKS